LLPAYKKSYLSMAKNYFYNLKPAIVTEILVVYSQHGGCKQPP
jgi:hypothetical protein